MYICREDITGNGVWIDQKINGFLVDTFFVQLSPRKHCSCKHFQESNNYYNHFHILLAEKWIKDGCPKSAMYEKDNNGKIKTLFEGIK